MHASEVCYAPAQAFDDPATMIKPQGRLTPLETAEVTWDAQGEPRSHRYDDPYYSNADGVAESTHVFIDGCDLPRRLAQHHRGSYRIGELGFGTGLNFILSWRAFRQSAPPSLRLHYVSIDKHPLRREEIERALASWPQLANEARALVQAVPPPVEGIHRRSFEAGRIVLDLHWADVEDAIAELKRPDQALFDSWYLDGFAPKRNPSMWNGERFKQLAKISFPGATVATYSAAGQVRRDLQSAGFEIHKRPGYGQKRESLVGTYTGDSPKGDSPTLSSAGSQTTPWDLNAANTLPPPTAAIVVGAGLAGAHIAASLARRGTAVTVLDRGSIAGRASGNRQGVLFHRLSHQRSNLADFSLYASLYATDLYRQMLEEGQDSEIIDGALNGCLQGLDADALGGPLAELLKGLPELGRLVNAEEGSDILGQKITGAGLWQAESGWFSPATICRRLLRHQGIELLEHCGELRLQTTEEGWDLRTETDNRFAAPVVIVAGGIDSNDLLPNWRLPTKPVRGQTTQVPASNDTSLNAAFCHKGYISPAMQGEHCIGATFAPGSADRDIRPGDHTENLHKLAEALPAWATQLASLDTDNLQGRAEVRCASPDYLPMVGPIPDLDAFQERFAPLEKDASTIINRRGVFIPGLYVTTAHGSRGLSYAALSAEVLASELFHEPSPVTADIRRAIAPARFLIRAMVRGTL